MEEFDRHFVHDFLLMHSLGHDHFGCCKILPGGATGAYTKLLDLIGIIAELIVFTYFTISSTPQKSS